MTEQLERLSPLIKVINDKLEKRINNELKEYDITFSQIRVIVLLFNSEKEEYSMKELEKVFQVSQQTVAGIIKRLENKMLVTSFLDPEDKRVKKIKLTESGEELGEKSCVMMAEIEDWLDKALTPDELVILKTLLQKIYIYIM